MKTMAGRNIVICCDGTGNEINQNLSNVLKLFRVARNNDNQIVYYDTGIGTLSRSNAWSRHRNKFEQGFGLATGWGLDDNVLDAYRFLINSYQAGDKIYLFGFSRGAYTVRVLAGLLNLVGLLRAPQRKLADYAFTTYKRAAEEGDLSVAWRVQNIMSTQRVPICFLGVWDTVSSVIVPRRDRFYIPSLIRLPYTATNPLVKTFRHALAIDERRRMFRVNTWVDQQIFKPNPFGKEEPQDIKQVWFSGVHSDVGGGYPEVESGLAKFPLKWMLDEAIRADLIVDTALYNHLVMGQPRKRGAHDYVAPSVIANTHDSMTLGWRPLEYLPKLVHRREWSRRRSMFNMYLPLKEPRLVPDDALIHESVLQRIEQVPAYQPLNLPKSYGVEPI